MADSLVVASGAAREAKHEFLARGDFMACLSTCDAALSKTDCAEVEHLLFLRGEAHHKLGNIDEALITYEQMLAHSPNHIGALQACASLYRSRNQLQTAQSLYSRLLELCPGDESIKRYASMTETDMGTILKNTGNSSAALDHYRRAISICSSYAPAHYNLGVCLAETGNTAEALKSYQKAIDCNPKYIEAFCNAGVIYKSLGNLDAAIAHYRRALAIYPNFEIVRNNYAIALSDLGTQMKGEGEIEEAKALYQKALVYNPQYADAYYNLGVLYGEQHDFDKALVSYNLAINFNSSYAEAHNNLGVIYKEQGNLERALHHYNLALAANPSFAQTLNNVGVVLTAQGKLDAAKQYCQMALQSNPDYADAHNNIGVILREEGKSSESLAAYEDCLRINPLNRNAGQNRLLALNYLPPDKCSHQYIYEEHMKWGKQFVPLFQKRGVLSPPALSKIPDVIRVGYVSGDFFTHSVSYFVEAMLRFHDRSRFEIFCYSNVAAEDTKTARLRSYEHHWRRIYGLTESEAARMIADDGIHILVDLSGHTAGNRLDIFALRPAPIQVTWIGYPNTTGLPTIDYRLTDPVADPVDTLQKFSEKLWRLPVSFLCYTPFATLPPVAPLPALQNGYVTFGSCNALAKITDDVIALWCKVLNAVAGSRLLMKAKYFGTPEGHAAYLARFAAHGIGADRLELVPYIFDTAGHLGAYARVDVQLDPFPYAGTTTTCESMVMGVPVITLRGECHANNVGASLNTSVGIAEETVANTAEEYIEKAVALTSNVSKLALFRADLRKRMFESPLCDGEARAHDVEEAFASMIAAATKRKSRMHAA